LLGQKGETIDLSLERIKTGFTLLLQKQPDVLIVEGAGGWRLPLGQDEQGQKVFMSDLSPHQNLSRYLGGRHAFRLF